MMLESQLWRWILSQLRLLLVMLHPDQLWDDARKKWGAFFAAAAAAARSEGLAELDTLADEELCSFPICTT